MRTAVVFVGGPRPQSKFVPAAALAAADLVIAVDSGLHLAQRCDRRADVVIGDMDSVDPEALERARTDGAEVLTFEVAKDATDLELALDEAIARGCDLAVVVGSDSGRIDHLIGATATLCSPRYRSLRIDAWWGTTNLVPIWDAAELHAHPGALLTLVPMNGDAHGVRTSGLRYPLHGETLPTGTSRGISNEFLGDSAVVELSGGCVVALISPDTIPNPEVPPT